jgi:NADH-quinone oxidoreductase subunit L
LSHANDSSILTFVLLAVAMPVVSCILCLLIPKRFMWLSAMAATLLMFVSVIAVGILYAKGWQVEVVKRVPWFDLGGQPNDIIILADHLSIPMLSMVILISFLVHLYSVGFMADDHHAGRYFACLGFFTFSMLGLVISGNLLVTFCFWELVGFSSYLLIGHWRERPAAGAAATKAFMFNRVGDALFIVGLALIYSQLGFDITHERKFYAGFGGLLIFCGVIGKSAQLPLSTWLPDAMEGPTPVSALIHAATMVAAGVYLMLRIPFIVTPFALIVGAITTLYGGWNALQQYDLKKILAYSTISQLGLMILAIGAGSDEGAFTHLLTHAFFKACLFLAAGAIIHSLYHVAHHGEFSPQDIRNMGGFRTVRPRLFYATTLALASLCGLPLFSGFTSKEMIIVPMIHRAIETGDWLMWTYTGVFFISSMLTVLYCYRLYVKVFFGQHATPYADLAPVPPVMQWPVSILAILSLGIFFWQFKDPNWHIIHPRETIVASISIGWTLVSLGLAWLLFTRRKVKTVQSKFSLDGLYDNIFVTPSLRLSSSLETFDKKAIDSILHGFVYSQVIIAKVVRYFDRYVVDGSVLFVTRVASGMGNLVRGITGGRIQSYLAWSAIALIIFIFWLLK